MMVVEPLHLYGVCEVSFAMHHGISYGSETAWRSCVDTETLTALCPRRLGYFHDSRQKFPDLVVVNIVQICVTCSHPRALTRP